MFSTVEQKYLLEMLKNEVLNKTQKTNSKTSQFYRIMALLKDNDLIMIIPNNKDSKSKSYKLTVFGRAMASIISKHTKTEPKYKKYAHGVELWLV